MQMPGSYTRTIKLALNLEICILPSYPGELCKPSARGPLCGALSSDWLHGRLPCTPIKPTFPFLRSPSPSWWTRKAGGRTTEKEAVTGLSSQMNFCPIPEATSSSGYDAILTFYLFLIYNPCNIIQIFKNMKIVQ
jgi:hypothetical protein